MRVLLDAEAATRGLRRVAGEIVERHKGTEDLLLVGIRRGGEPVAREIAHWVKELEGRQLPIGTVDITLYRDDAATALPNPRIGPSEIPGTIEGKRVVLVDDVRVHRPHHARRHRRADGLRAPAPHRAGCARRSRRPRAADPARLRGRNCQGGRPTTASTCSTMPWGSEPSCTAPAPAPYRRASYDPVAPAPPAQHLRSGSRARARTAGHGRGVSRGDPAPGAQGAHAARQDGHQHVLRGVDAHAHLLRAGGQAAQRRRGQLRRLAPPAPARARRSATPSRRWTRCTPTWW